MTSMQLVLIALAGGAGAALRYIIDSHVPQSHFPAGTLIVNLCGSFALGIVMGMMVVSNLNEHTLAIVGTGFCGGLTTFSTASVSAYQLLRESKTRTALIYAWGMLVGCIALAYIGLFIGTQLH